MSAASQVEAESYESPKVRIEQRYQDLLKLLSSHKFLEAFLYRTGVGRVSSPQNAVMRIGLAIVLFRSFVGKWTETGRLHWSEARSEVLRDLSKAEQELLAELEQVLAPVPLLDDLVNLFYSDSVLARELKRNKDLVERLGALYRRVAFNK